LFKPSKVCWTASPATIGGGALKSCLVRLLASLLGGPEELAPVVGHETYLLKVALGSGSGLEFFDFAPVRGLTLLATVLPVDGVEALSNEKLCKIV
jgi:hypothetical protein